MTELAEVRKSMETSDWQARKLINQAFQILNGVIQPTWSSVLASSTWIRLFKDKSDISATAILHVDVTCKCISEYVDRNCVQNIVNSFG